MSSGFFGISTAFSPWGFLGPPPSLCCGTGYSVCHRELLTLLCCLVRGLWGAGRSLARGVRQAPASVGRDCTVYLRTRLRMCFGGDGAGGGSYGQPFRVASDAAEEAASFSGTDGCVALTGQDGGLGAFVGQVGFGGG